MPRRSDIHTYDKKFDSSEGQVFYGPARRVVKDILTGKGKPNFPFATNSSSRKKK